MFMGQAWNDIRHFFPHPIGQEISYDPIWVQSRLKLTGYKFYLFIYLFIFFFSGYKFYMKDFHAAILVRAYHVISITANKCSQHFSIIESYLLLVLLSNHWGQERIGSLSVHSFRDFSSSSITKAVILKC